MEPATHSCCRGCIYDLPVPDQFGKHGLGFCHKGSDERSLALLIGNISYIFDIYAYF